MLTFESPQYLLLFLLLPPAIYFRHFRKNRGGILSFPFRVWKGIGFYPNQIGLKSILFFLSLLFWLGITSFLFVLGGPALSRHEKLFLSRGIDIMIVFDQSPSMAGKDFPPVNRFQTAKEMTLRFIAGRENDPIGIVSFGTDAVLRVPPTLDYGVLKERLESLQIMELGEGTAIGMGLAVAALHLSTSNAKEKVIILLTDGENNSGEIQPETSASIASKLGIRIYSIGIGQSGEVSAEFIDPVTGSVFSASLMSNFDEPLLEKIAEETGGRYFHAISPGTLEAVFQTIDSLESVERLVKMQVVFEPLHHFFIFIGFIFIMSEFFFRKVIFREIL
ncbi:MAG: VWA domain-containing protein [Spirochaetaceae bacterium]|jgi:Ca-activated chloride channel family protein|nr:VWA domain-containing protein [Spirochaetaceae bacterium]